jgi:hypothetical protein
LALDPNWLYSATAQSGAAIVAILGGFITSRILAVNAEKQGFKNQLEAESQRLQLLKEQEKKANEDWSIIAAHYFFLNIDLEKVKKIPAFDQLKEKFPMLEDYGIYARTAYLKILENRLAAKNFISDNIDSIEESKKQSTVFSFGVTPLDTNDFGKWLDLLKSRKVDVSGVDTDALAVEYHLLSDKESDDEQFLSRVNTPRSWFNLANTAQYDIFERERKVAIEKDHYDDLKKIRYEILFVDNEVNRLKVRLNSISQPPNLVWGVLSLLYLAMVGIIVPLVLLPTDTYSDYNKDVVIILFSSGLLFVFLYILFQIRSLGR